MEMKRLTDCTLREMVVAWNRGFNGYAVDLAMDETVFVNRLVTEGLSPHHSIVAFVEGEPVGIIMNGFRKRGGKTIAWNGGTAIAPEYRGSGIIHSLMQETMTIYEQEKVQVATLEAIKSNEKAIKLYEKYGYAVVDELVFLVGKRQDVEPMEYESCRPEQLLFLPNYQERAVWQCQPDSLKYGEAYIFKESERVIGYSLFRKVWDEEGKLIRINVYQLKLTDGGEPHNLFRMLAAFSKGNIPIMMVNFVREQLETRYLLEHGFTVTTEQVWMEKSMT